MNPQIIEFVLKYSGEILTFALTTLGAWLKRKHDLKKIKKQHNLELGLDEEQ